MADRLRHIGIGIKKRRGWSGLVGGLVLGVVLTLVFTTYIRPLWDDSDRPDPGPLVILSGADDSSGKQRQSLVEEWNALNPQNPAHIEETSDNADAQHSEMVARAQDGHGGVDIYNLDVTWTAEFASASYIRPLAKADTDGFLDQPLDTCRYQDQLWALPFNTDAGLLYYRSDLVTKAPTTWQQIVTASQTALSTARNGLAAGYAAQLDDYEGLTVNALEAIWAAGGDAVTPDGAVTIDSPEARTGLTRLANGLTSGTPTVILQTSTSFKEADTTAAFSTGKVLFMRNWPVAYATLDPPTGGDAKPPVHFQVTNLPGPSALGGQNLAIAKGSAHPRAAQRLIAFLTSERSQQILFERGGFAATREIVYRDTTVTGKYPYASTLLNAIRHARNRPVTPHYEQFSETFRAVVRAALADGGQLPSNAVSRLGGALKGYKN